jgi:hypothetical protein
MSDNATPIDALLAQGCCCGSGCENCPYVDEATGARHVAGTTTLNQKWVDFKTANPGKTFQDWQASVAQ